MSYRDTTGARALQRADELNALRAALAAAEARAERLAGQNARLLRYVLAVRRMKRCTALELYAAKIEEEAAQAALQPGDLGEESEP